VKGDTGDVGAEGRRFEYAEGGMVTKLPTQLQEGTQMSLERMRCPAFAVYHTVEVRMYPHVFGRLCTPTEQTVRKKPKTQEYANKGSMATAHKQS